MARAKATLNSLNIFDLKVTGVFQTPFLLKFESGNFLPRIEYTSPKLLATHACTIFTCSCIANALEAAGFQCGDALAIDMPMNQFAVIAYLGIVLAGCVVVSIADSFVPSEIATRLRLAKAKGIFTQVLYPHYKVLHLQSKLTPWDHSIDHE